MPRKIVLVGPQDVGKSTIRKWLFEGESLFKLLENPTEPTYGAENYSYHFLDDLGVFDLAGQETNRWFGEDQKIFTESDIILNVLESTLESSIIEKYIKTAVEIQIFQAKTADLFFLVHKIDLLNKVSLETLLGKLQLLQKFISQTTGKEIHLFYTSFKPEFLSKTIDNFIEIFHLAGLDKEAALNTDLMRINNGIFRILRDQKTISVARLQILLEVPLHQILTLIDSYEGAGLIKTTSLNNQMIVELTSDGNTYYEKLLHSFSEMEFETKEVKKENVEILAQVPIFERKPEEQIYGLMISDSNGKTLVIVETKKGSLNNVLNRENNPQFDIELIPMFLNAMSKFAEEINVQELANFRVQGQNLKMNSLTKSGVMLTLFTHPDFHTEHVRNELQELFENFFLTFPEEIKIFFETGNVTEFARFLPTASEKVKLIIQKYKELQSRASSFDFSKAKEFYAKLNLFNESNLIIEEQLAFKTLKVRLLEAILAEDVQNYLLIESQIIEYMKK